MDVLRLLEAAAQCKASDLMLSAGMPPTVRIKGQLKKFDLPPLTPQEIHEMVYSLLTQDQISRFEQDRELDFSINYQDKARFRGNAYWQKSSVAMVLRRISSVVPSLADLNLPSSLEQLCLNPQGLLLFTGPTGHGKSTTQAAIIRHISEKRAAHIITVEDPIEYLHTSNTSIIDQREVGEDTRSFAMALRHVLRQNPDVILIGELRDLESMATALTAAETGHLVLGTLHTNSAAQAIDRVIDVFPPHQQNQIRTQLSFSLLAIVSQRLLPRADGTGLIPAVEVLRNVPAIANLIREGKTQQIPSVLETQRKVGMQSMDSVLKDLYKCGTITREVAAKHMAYPENMG